MSLKEEAFELLMQFPVMTRKTKEGTFVREEVACRGMEDEQISKEGEGSSLAPGQSVREDHANLALHISPCSPSVLRQAHIPSRYQEPTCVTTLLFNCMTRSGL